MGSTLTVDVCGPVCFAAGTGIATPYGDVAVEALRVGDIVLTHGGATRPIRWIGERRLDLTHHSVPERAQPVRILADAFATGVPRHDLRLSPDHAVLLDGMLIPVRLLINGASIVREVDCRTVTYFHIELDAHDVLLAEGLPAESYLDTGNRGFFDDGITPLLLYPDVTGQARREAESCAPFAADAAARGAGLAAAGDALRDCWAIDCRARRKPPETQISASCSAIVACGRWSPTTGATSSPCRPPTAPSG